MAWRMRTSAMHSVSDFRRVFDFLPRRAPPFQGGWGVLYIQVRGTAFVTAAVTGCVTDCVTKPYPIGPLFIDAPLRFVQHRIERRIAPGPALADELRKDGASHPFPGMG